MCSNCYHKYGRTKKPWICGHEKLYACKNTSFILFFQKDYVKIVISINIIKKEENKVKEKNKKNKLKIKKKNNENIIYYQQLNYL